MTADRKQQLRGTPARPADRRDPLCPMCGDHKLKSESVRWLVELVHQLELREDLVLTTERDAEVERVAPLIDAGTDYLLSGAGTFRANIEVAVRRLMHAIRDRRFPYGDGKMLVIVCTEDEAREALQSALDRIA